MSSKCFTWNARPNSRPQCLLRLRTFNFAHEGFARLSQRRHQASKKDKALPGLCDVGAGGMPFAAWERRVLSLSFVMFCVTEKKGGTEKTEILKLASAHGRGTARSPRRCRTLQTSRSFGLEFEALFRTLRSEWWRACILWWSGGKQEAFSFLLLEVVQPQAGVP